MIAPPYLVDTPVVRQDLANYYHEVSRFDYYIGQVVEELKRQGVLETTLIVVAADNGRPFPRDKSRLYDSGIKTPWIVHYPRLIQKPATSRRFVSTIDLSATCLEYQVRKDPYQLRNQAEHPAYAEMLDQARGLLAAWTEQTGDTIPMNPTPHRHAPSWIVDGEILPRGERTGAPHPHAEFPGAAKNAAEINHPEPIHIDAERVAPDQG